MEEFDPGLLQKLYRSPKESHKGQNGRLLVIGGSKLFHASAFWAAEVASRIVDLVHFSSPAMENNDLVRRKAKEGFWNGIVVPWERVEEYIREDDCVVIGPGMTRVEDTGMENGKWKMESIRQIRQAHCKQAQDRNGKDWKEAAENDRTELITNYLLKKYSQKRWVIDGGALQELRVGLIPRNAILTPHSREFDGLMTRSDLVSQGQTLTREDQVKWFAKKFHCVVLLKGIEDIICTGGKCDPSTSSGQAICKPGECVVVEGGNEGMTKGGTGDVLAGLVGALYCKNEAMLAAIAGSFINKRAGDNLYKNVGPYFNASDLVKEVPGVMKEELRY